MGAIDGLSIHVSSALSHFSEPSCHGFIDELLDLRTIDILQGHRTKLSKR